MGNISNKERFIVKAIKIHKNKYDYSKVVYIKNNIKVLIKCTTCNNEFLQTPRTHLEKRGCPICKGLNRRLTNEIFIEKAKKIHNDVYEYSKSKYIKSSIKLSVTCNICGNEFLITPNNHLRGKGCPLHTRGFSKTEWINFCNSKPKYIPNLYIIRCFNNNESFIKIGITTSSVYYRFRRNKRQLPYSYEILKEIKGSPDFVWDKEKELHKLCRPFQYTPLISFAGYTECFTLECLNLLNI